MEINLIVKYSSSAGYMTAKNEVHALMTRLGDQKSEQELLAPGVMGVSTHLRSRDVIEELQDLFLSDPDCVKSTVEWAPADNWCDASVNAILQSVKDDIKDMFAPQDVYSIDVRVHRGSILKEQIIAAVKPWLKGAMNDERPQKILRIEVFDKAAVTLIRPKDIFRAI